MKEKVDLNFLHVVHAVYLPGMSFLLLDMDWLVEKQGL